MLLSFCGGAPRPSEGPLVAVSLGCLVTVDLGLILVGLGAELAAGIMAQERKVTAGAVGVYCLFLLFFWFQCQVFF